MAAAPVPVLPMRLLGLYPHAATEPDLVFSQATEDPLLVASHAVTDPLFVTSQMELAPLAVNDFTLCYIVVSLDWSDAEVMLPKLSRKIGKNLRI